MIKEIFAFDWDEPVSRDERSAIMEGLSRQVVGRGLQVPAIWTLEMHRPLMPLLGQCAIALSPLLGTLLAGGACDLQKYTKLMREPGATEELIRMIEAKSEEQQLAAR